MLRALRRELARRYLLVLAIVVGAYCLGAFGLVRAILTAGLDEANHHLALPLATAAERPGTTLEGLARDLGRMRLGPGEHLALHDPAGRMVARLGDPGAGPAADGVAEAHGLRTLARPLGRGADRLGTVVAGHAVADRDHALRLLTAGLAGMFAAALAFAAAVGGWLAAKAVAPVEAAILRERQFTRDAAHELRTPLAVLRLHADMAREAADGPAAAPLATVDRLLRRMSALVDDLLTLSREEADPAAPAQVAALADLAEEEVELLAPLARERGVRLEAALDDEGARVAAAPERLARAIRIMVDNAIRYAPPGGLVAVRLAADAAEVRLAVTNDGPPIPAGEREAVFERFHRTDAGRAANPAGSGLGLPIARAIARAHGGDLALTSPPEAPTTFTLALPRRP